MNLKKRSILCLYVVIVMTTLKTNAACAPLLDHSVRQLAEEQVDSLCSEFGAQIVFEITLCVASPHTKLPHAKTLHR
jgi:glutathione peroxidase